MIICLLITLGIIFNLIPAVYAAGITPPEAVVYHCPSLPSSFTVGNGMFKNGAIWRISVDDIAQGSKIEMNASDKYEYIGNPVYESIFGKTLWCDGTLSINGKEYHLVVNSRVTETKCDGNPDKQSFTCMP